MSAGIVRRMSVDMKTSLLTTDRSEAHSVRHWNSNQQTQLEVTLHTPDLVDHNPNYPRIKVPSFDKQ